MNLPLMDIRIGIDPDIFEIGSLVLTWHGFLTFVAVAVAVILVGRWSKKAGMATDPIYSVAVWAIIGGVIGSRALHVIDLWNEIYWPDPIQIIQVWEGGVTIYGAILGGFLGGGGYIYVRNHPRFITLWNSLFKGAKLEKADLPSIGRLADLVAPAVLLAMAIGRVGDIINGEHVSKLTDLPWGFVYINSESPSNAEHGLAASHPAVVYEMLLDLVLLGVIWQLRNRLRPPGMLFALYLATYSLGKFFISFLRVGPAPMDREWAIGLNEAHFVAIVVLAITLPLLAVKAQFVRERRRTRG